MWHICGLLRQRGPDRALVTNYFVSLLKLYRAYWRVILPYRFDMRPLAVCCSGDNYTEDVIRGPVNPKLVKDDETGKRRLDLGHKVWSTRNVGK